jgi:biotin synthase
VINHLITKLYETNHLEKEELAYLIQNCDENVFEKISSLALKTRLKVYGKDVYLRALLEFTNYCRNSCCYCGIRKENRKVTRYRLTGDQIRNCCQYAYANGYRTLVLQGGEDDYFTTGKLSGIIREIKRTCPDAAVTLSIGERDRKSYEALFEAGTDRFLLRHETTSRCVYTKLHPGMSFESRIKCLKDLKAIGFQTGAGFIVGLDEGTPARLAEELFFLKELEADMVGIGPLVPHPETPLANYERGSVKTTLLMMALTRLLLPGTLIPISTALNTIADNGWQRGLQSGANVLMPVITPADTRKNYEIYKDKQNVDCVKLERIKAKIKNSGFKVDMERGDSKYFTGVRT